VKSYYQIIQLLLGKSIEITKNKLVINLDAANLEQIINSDRIFLNSSLDHSYFWVSGGGTYLINNRYLVIVKRSSWSKVNPNQYSLFTGRADSILELTQPNLLVRELFEELILTTNSHIYYPKFSFPDQNIQDTIDRTYQDLEQKFNLDLNQYQDLNLDLISTFDQDIDLKYQESDRHFKLNFYINSKNDINILFLFSVHLDISDLLAQDGEYHLSEDGKLIKHNREIYLYDLKTHTIQGVSSNSNQKITEITNSQITEHLSYLIYSNLKV
jgi:hypothetical protein